MLANSSIDPPAAADALTAAELESALMHMPGMLHNSICGKSIEFLLKGERKALTQAFMTVTVCTLHCYMEAASCVPVEMTI